MLKSVLAMVSPYFKTLFFSEFSYSYSSNASVLTTQRSMNLPSVNELTHNQSNNNNNNNNDNDNENNKNNDKNNNDDGIIMSLDESDNDNNSNNNNNNIDIIHGKHVTIIYEENIHPYAFECIQKYCYFKNPNLNCDNILYTLSACEYFMIQPLERQCLYFLNDKCNINYEFIVNGYIFMCVSLCVYVCMGVSLFV